LTVFINHVMGHITVSNETTSNNINTNQAYLAQTLNVCTSHKFQVDTIVEPE